MATPTSGASTPRSVADPVYVVSRSSSPVNRDAAPARNGFRDRLQLALDKLVTSTSAPGTPAAQAQLKGRASHSVPSSPRKGQKESRVFDSAMPSPARTDSPGPGNFGSGQVSAAHSGQVTPQEPASPVDE